jgi:rhodanese-related sulfurtransferase
MTNARHQISFPRAWASLTPPTCAVLDGRAPELEQMGQPGRLLSGVGGRAGQNNKNQIPTAEITERTANRTRARLASSDIFQSRGVSSCVHTTKRKFRPLQNCRDGFRRGMTKLSLRQIGHGLQGIAGRKNARLSLRASRVETSARQSGGWLASLNRPTPSWSRSFKSYSRDNPHPAPRQ